MIYGIDVSEYQGRIIWADVKSAGRDFAAIKATEGLGFEDPHFKYNWYHSKQRGILRIAYHFLRPELDGAQQASYLHSYVRANGRFEVGDGVMLDLEETDNQSPHKVITCAESFVQQILKETRAGVFIYTGFDFWHNQLGNPHSNILARCPLWQASWHANPLPLGNWPSGAALQQYAADGRVYGIVPQVDLDQFFGPFNTLAALCRVGGRQ